MSEEIKKEKVFVDGVTIQAPLDQNKDWHVARMGFNVVKFFRWMQDHQNEKGWVDVDIKISPRGPWYGELNQWKPEKKEEPQPTLDDINVNTPVEDIPF